MDKNQWRIYRSMSYLSYYVQSVAGIMADI